MDVKLEFQRQQRLLAFLQPYLMFHSGQSIKPSDMYLDDFYLKTGRQSHLTQAEQHSGVCRLWKFHLSRKKSSTVLRQEEELSNQHHRLQVTRTEPEHVSFEWNQ